MWPERRPGRGSGASPRKRSRRAGVDDLRVAELGAGGDLGHVAHEARVAAGGEVAVAQDRDPVLDRPALGAPLRQAAVEDRDVGLAEEAEGPPDPGRAEDAVGVVDHHPVAVADAHGAHAADELLHRRGHVRQARLGVGDLVDVEEARAGDMRRRELGAGVAPRRRHVPARVEDAQVRRAEMRGQPVGRDQKLWIAARHALLPCACAGPRHSGERRRGQGQGAAPHPFPRQGTSRRSAQRIRSSIA